MRTVCRGYPVHSDLSYKCRSHDGGDIARWYRTMSGASLRDQRTQPDHAHDRNPRRLRDVPLVEPDLASSWRLLGELVGSDYREIARITSARSVHAAPDGARLANRRTRNPTFGIEPGIRRFSCRCAFRATPPSTRPQRRDLSTPLSSGAGQRSIPIRRER